MIRTFTGKRRILFFPKKWANAVSSWLLGVHSPSGTVVIRNTANPTQGGSATFDVDMEKVASGLKGRLAKWFASPRDVAAAIAASADGSSLVTRDGRLLVNADWLRQYLAANGGGTGTVKSVDGAQPDASGNVALGAVTTGTAQTITATKTFASGTVAVENGGFRDTIHVNGSGQFVFTGTGVMLNGGAANAVELSYAPADHDLGGSKAVATMGWANGKFAKSAATAARNHAHGNLTSDGKLANASAVVVTGADKAVTADAGLSADKMKSVLAAFASTDDDSHFGKKVELRHASSASGITIDATTSTHRILLGYSTTVQSSITNSTGGKLTVDGKTGVELTAPADAATLANAPTAAATATASKAIATCGWTADNFMPAGGMAANKWVKTNAEGNVTTVDDTPAYFASSPAGGKIVATDGATGKLKTVSGLSGTKTKTVVTGVTWNGTALKFTSETWTITDGVVTSIAANGDTTIDTPVEELT